MSKKTKTLALKYRPTTLDRYVGNELIKATVQDMVDQDNIPNAIMLHGPTGSGKTTMARIIVRMINGTKTIEEGDLEELNAATHRGIDEVRSLIERAQFAPTNRYKAIIIDEGHQMTPQAMEAMLKPLEEPPPNTLYILCTTDLHKFPKKIIDRCKVLPVRPPEQKELARHLFNVAKREGQPIDKPLAMMIAKYANSSIRSAMYRLEAVMVGLRAGLKAEDLVTQYTEEEEVGENIAASLIMGLYHGDVTEALNSCLHMPKDSSANDVVTKAMWAAAFVLAVTGTKQFATPNTFPSDFNKKALAEAKNAKVGLDLAMRVYRFLYNLRTAIMGATTTPSMVALAAVSEFFAEHKE